MSDISEWLKKLDLGEYAETFIENKIDLRVLPEIDADDLKELEIPLGPRKLLLKAISHLNSQAETSEEFNSEPVGAGLPGAQFKSDAERRQLTVMFVDLVGSTGLSRKLDPEEMRDVITTFQNAVAGAVTRFDGQVAKYMGDGVLCYFGWPVAHEDDAERAVRSGLAIMQSLVGISAPDGEQISARTGIATGLVVVGDLIGKGSAQEEAVVGDTPNLAARLQGAAEPGQVIVSETTKNLIGDLFEVVNLGSRDLKGIGEGMPIYALSGERLTESRFAAKSTDKNAAMVGRDQELALLLDRWQLALSGEGQMVLLTGEAGIGKSRIAQGLIDALQPNDYTRISYQCSPYHMDSALYPAVQHLALAARFEANDDTETKLDKLVSMLIDAPDTGRPESIILIAGLLGLGEIAESRFGALELTPQQRRTRTLEALFDQFAKLAQARPVLFALEDAHWIDPTTLELVELCLDRIGNMPVLILVTARPVFEYGFGGHPIVTRLALNRLGRDQVGSIVSRITKGKNLPQEVLEEIAIKTDGVPLFVEEFTKTLLESKALRETDDEWVIDGAFNTSAIPTSLHDSLMARLDRLKSVKEVAQTAACIGRDFSHQLLSRISPLDSSELNDALERLMNAELLFRRGRPPDATYLFKHALVRDAAYESLLKKNRKKIHISIVDALEEFASEGTEIEPALLAYHCTEADLKPQAIAYWGKAGQEAIQRSANVEAIAHLTYGIELIQTLSENDDRDEQELKFQTMLAGPLIATKGYGASETGEVFARALELSRTVDDPNFLFPVLYQQWVYNLIGSGIDEAHQRAMDFKEIADRQTDTMPQVVAHRVTGVSLYYKGDFSHSKAEFDHALSLYDEEQHKEATFRFGQDPKSACLAFLSSLLHIMGHIDQSRDVGVLALDRAKQLKHTNTLAYTLFFSAVRNAFCRRDLPELEKATDSLSSLANEQGLEMWTAYALINCGWIASQKGNAKEGVKLCEAGLAKMQETGTGLDRPLGLAQLAECHAACGQNEKALAVLEDALDNIEQTNDRWYEAELLRLKGDQIVALKADGWIETAKQNYDASLATARAQQAKFWELRSATSLAYLLHANEDSNGARETLEPALEGFAAVTGSADVEAAKSLLAKLSI